MLTALASGEIFIQAENRDATTGNFFTVNVIEEPAANVGDNLGSPVNITGLLPSYLDVVGIGFSNFYVVTGLVPGSYLVRLGGLTGDVDLEVYNDVGFTGLECSSGVSIANLGCVATTNGSGELYIKVIGIVTGNFTVDILNPPVDEGSIAAPVNITGLIPYEGSFLTPPPPTPTGSFYVIENLIPLAPFNITLTNVTDGSALEVYSDSGFTTLLCTSDETENLNESCPAVAANASGKLFINVLKGKNFVSGATYTINVRQ